MSYVDIAQIASAIFAGVSAIFAGIGLLTVARQIQQSRRATALETLQSFMSDINERERALRDDADKRHALIEFMNLLELYSAASNERLLEGVALEFVNDKIIDSIVILKNVRDWHSEINRSQNSEAVYKDLLRFMEKHRDLIAARQAKSRESVAACQTSDTA